MPATATRPVDQVAEIRAEMARRMLPIYVLASRVGLHPAHLGQVLRGNQPLTAQLAEKIMRALAEELDRVVA